MGPSPASTGIGITQSFSTGNVFSTVSSIDDLMATDSLIDYRPISTLTIKPSGGITYDFFFENFNSELYLP